MPEHSSSLTGWGRTAPTVAHVVEAGAAEVAGVIATAGARGVIARGLGRSYGDAAQNAGGTVLLPVTGTIRIERRADDVVVHAAAGTSLHELMVRLLSERLFVTVTPGTRYVTVGGAVAADIHGKNHHRDGSFGDQIESLELVGADGVSRRIGPDREPELFWATVGGMGLTGVITSVALRARPVESAYVSVHTERIDDLATLMERMRTSDVDYHYSVAWIDTLARGRRMGRSVLTRAGHATADQLTGRAARDPWPVPGSARIAVPVTAPRGLISRPTVRAFNELWFRKAPRDRRDELQSIATFFHPLDGVDAWNRLYGPGGLIQYQLVVPDGAEDAMTEALRLISDAGHASFLAVLKRFGPGNPGLLSFPMAGWTLALDLPATASLAGLFRTLDEIVVAAGGRLYLAKDSRLSANMFERMYPRVQEFRAVRRSVDPQGVFQSDLSRRLHL